MGIRIVGGRHKGRKLFTPKGLKTRPTASRTREAVFNIIGARIRDAVVLDLFAGSGAMGLEALSRGAGRAVLIDRDADCIRTITRNVTACGLSAHCRILPWDIVKNLHCLPPLGLCFNLVFMDPPYDTDRIQPAMRNLTASQSLDPEAWIVVEHAPSETITALEAGLECFDCRKYGKTLVSFLRPVLIGANCKS
jgi:16S rRNA (guanine966-N2)-methyltransferase